MAEITASMVKELRERTGAGMMECKKALTENNGDIDAAMANSAVYLEAFGHIVIAWIWLEQVLAAEGRTGEFYDGKRQAARYFFRYELPRTGPQLDLLESLDRTTLEMRPDWF